MSYTFKGKALLVIDRLWTENPKEFHWDIDSKVFSLNVEDIGDEVKEHFDCMSYDIISAPAAAYRMEVGDRIRVQVTFEIHYSRDYWGECDSDMYLTREKVLRYQPYNSRRYRKNFYTFWKSTQTDKLTA